MAILVTRPQPDNDSTAARLRGQGFDVLAAPMLRFEPLPAAIDADSGYRGVIVTSANALRALAGQRLAAEMLALPLFAVGDHTAQAAREAGFTAVVSARGDADDLHAAVTRSRAVGAGATLLYLAGADTARDLAGVLKARGFHVVIQTVYRMAPVAGLPDAAAAALASGTVEAVLHYSRRSAEAFFAAAGHAGVEISALAVPHGCISEAVAAIARAAGATRVFVAASPNEDALVAALLRNKAALSR